MPEEYMEQLPDDWRGDVMFLLGLGAGTYRQIVYGEEPAPPATYRRSGGISLTGVVLIFGLAYLAFKA